MKKLVLAAVAALFALTTLSVSSESDARRRLFRKGLLKKKLLKKKLLKKKLLKKGLFKKLAGKAIVWPRKTLKKAGRKIRRLYKKGKGRFRSLRRKIRRIRISH